MGINLDKNNFINRTAYLEKNRLNKKNYNDLGKPLNKNVNFRGLFSPVNIQKFSNAVLPSKYTEIPTVLEKRCLNLLKSKSENLANLYIGFKDLFIKRAKESENFRIKFGIDKKGLDIINNGSAITIPEQNLFRKFISNIFSPLKIFGDLYSYILDSKIGEWGKKHSKFIAKLVEKNSENLQDAQIVKNYRSYTGLLDSLKIWETKQRKIAGVSGWDGKKDLLTSQEIFESKALRRWLKSVDPTKGKYQTKHQMLGNRLISGLVYGTFLGNDAYNTTIRYSNNKDEANSQRRSRFAQELAKIGINMYLINLFVGTFEKYVNKSLFHALFMASATSMTAEILGRNLVGRPIFPSDKETLDEIARKRADKKGIWVTLGKLISGAKPPHSITSQNNTRKLMVLSDESKFSYDTSAGKTSFKGRANGSNLSFGSFFKVTNYMSTKNVKELLELLKEADFKIYNNFIDIIEKSLKKTTGGKDLQTILNTEALIPIGTKKTVHGNIVRSVASPYFFIRDTGKSIISGIKKMFTPANTSSSFDDMMKDLNKLIKENPVLESEYNKFSQKMKLSRLWQASPLDENTKNTKILSEFLETIEKDTEEIEGIKNIFSYLNKQLKSKEVNPENAKAVRNLLFDNFKRTDGAANLEYDGNTFAMMNINLSRAITTLFLVVDAYNLSMQYSNNDKNTAINNGKSRALQEASRITVSAYMLAFVHNLLSKFCNSSLFGAFTTTALTSSINDTLARKAVGVPIGTKTAQELAEIDKQNAKSKSPLKRTLAYLIGKRQKNNSSHNPNNNNSEYDFSLSITKSFKSILDSK